MIHRSIIWGHTKHERIIRMISKEDNTSETHKSENEQLSQEKEQHVLWDNSNFFILLLDSLGIEIVNDRGTILPTSPIYLKCSFKVAQKVSKSSRFKVELCAEDIWRISYAGVEYPVPDDGSWIPWVLHQKKEAPTLRAELWLDMMIEDSYLRKMKVLT